MRRESNKILNMGNQLILGAIFLTIVLDFRVMARSDTHKESTIDWNVHFESGKESAKLYEPNHALFLKRYLKIQNLAGEGLVAKVACEDPFSSFSNDELNYGDVWEFSIMDFLSKRHYWCSVTFTGRKDGRSFNGGEYTFRAYGELAPRGNNRVILLRDKAKINGRDVTILHNEV